MTDKTDTHGTLTIFAGCFNELTPQIAALESTGQEDCRECCEKQHLHIKLIGMASEIFEPKDFKAWVNKSL